MTTTYEQTILFWSGLCSRVFPGEFWPGAGGVLPSNSGRERWAQRDHISGLAFYGRLGLYEVSAYKDGRPVAIQEQGRMCG